MSAMAIDSVHPRSTDGPLPSEACAVKLQASIPRQATTGAALNLKCTVENLGSAVLLSTPPHPVRMAYRWRRGSALIEPSDSQEPRFVLPRPLAPGESVTCPVSVRTPTEEGEYLLCLSLVQEDVAWFEEVNEASACRQVVQVQMPDPLERLGTTMGVLSRQESESRAALLAAQQFLERYDQELRVVLSDLRATVTAVRSAPPDGTGKAMDGTETEPAGQRHPYRQLVEEVQEVVLQATPPGAVVAVVSRGDPELLRFEERVGWHFPQTDEGVYAGCYPAESEEAIAQLEALRAKGATHLVFPSTASWWLEHYGGLREHVDAHCQRVWADERCTIYRVTEAVTAPLDGRRSTSWERVRRLFVRSAAS